MPDMRGAGSDPGQAGGRPGARSHVLMRRTAARLLSRLVPCKRTGRASVTFWQSMRQMGLIYLVTMSGVGVFCEGWLLISNDPFFRWWVLVICLPVLIVCWPILLRGPYRKKVWAKEELCEIEGCKYARKPGSVHCFGHQDPRNAGYEGG